MKKYILGSCVWALAFLPTGVMAGFQFTAPIEQTTPQPTIQGGLLPTPPSDIPMMPSVPNIEVQAAPSPSITRSDIIFNNPVPAVSQAPTPIAIIQYEQPTSIATAPNQLSMPSPDLYPEKNTIGQGRMATPSPMITQSSTNDFAVGFGNDIPLATALRQIVPADYSYVIDKNVNGEQFVSWNGGKEWPLVMNDVIEPLGLKSSIDGKIVRLEPAEQAQTPSVPAFPMAQDIPAVPMAIIPETQNSTPYAPSTMDLEDIEAKAVASLPIPPRDIIMQDFQSPQQSVVPEVSMGQWRAQNGDSLRTVIESWANIEGVDLFWSSEFDYKLAGDVNISGNFEQAIETLLSGFSQAQPRPTGRLHPNLPHGPAVLIVETQQSIN